MKTSAPILDAARFVAASTLILCASVTTVPAATPTNAELIEGIVGRFAAMYSMRIEYEYETVAKKDDGSVLAQDKRQLRISQQGRDWVAREVGSPTFTMRRNQATIRYLETPTKQASIERSLHIDAPITLEALISSQTMYAPFRLGTLWFPEQAEFVNQHRADVKRLEAQLIAGVLTEVLEWHVDVTALGSAFLMIPPKIADARQGRLRVFAAPSLDYAVPRFQYVAPNGDVELNVESTDFRRDATGVCLPRQASLQFAFEHGNETSNYRLRSIESVNETLPEEEFALTVPENTQVRDRRPGVPTSAFTVKSPAELAAVNKVISAQPAQTSSNVRRVLLTINVSLLMVCFALLARRRQRSESR